MEHVMRKSVLADLRNSCGKRIQILLLLRRETGANTMSYTPLTDAEIEALAKDHEAFGFGLVDKKGFTTHGFDPEGMGAFARAVEAAVLARIAQAEPAAWQGGFTNDELLQAWRRKINVEPSAKELTAFSLGCEVGVARMNPPAGMYAALLAVEAPKPARPDPVVEGRELLVQASKVLDEIIAVLRASTLQGREFDSLGIRANNVADSIHLHLETIAWEEKKRAGKV
jgi:hypothetical protein